MKPKLSRPLSLGGSALGDWPLAQLPGLSAATLQLWEQVGITTTGQLHRTYPTPSHQDAIAAQLRIHPQQVRKWVAMARLAQVPSVGCTHCGLLLHAGIVTLDQLATASLPHLHHTLKRLHVSLMQRRDLCPPVEDINRWIQEAQQLARSRTWS